MRLRCSCQANLTGIKAARATCLVRFTPVDVKSLEESMQAAWLPSARQGVSRRVRALNHLTFVAEDNQSARPEDPLKAVDTSMPGLPEPPGREGLAQENP